MDGFSEAFALVLDRWWQVSLAILACSVSIIGAEYLGLTRSWLFPIGLGGILSLTILEAYPHAWILGEYTHIVLWIVLACMAYLLPTVLRNTPETKHGKTIWEYFGDVDSVYSPLSQQPDQKGASAWVESS
jgi:hypothetical protein